MLKRLAVKLLFLVAPQYAEAAQRETRRKRDVQFAADLGLPRISEAYIERNGLEVKHGVFKGMSYPGGVSTGSVLVPKLLGSYESELDQAWKTILETDYETIVDIGCAEGYYAVGFARQQSSCRILAYDTDPHAQKLCRIMAAHNNVAGSVTVRGTATVDELNEVVKGRCLVLCDCEGAEIFILNPIDVPALLACDIVVEVHSFVDPTIAETLKRRFVVTHEIAYIAAQERDPNAYEEIAFLSAEDREKAVSECRREGMGWLVMRVKS
jgi:hypothetical protein